MCEIRLAPIEVRLRRLGGESELPHSHPYPFPVPSKQSSLQELSDFRQVLNLLTPVSSVEKQNNSPSNCKEIKPA